MNDAAEILVAGEFRRGMLEAASEIEQLVTRNREDPVPADIGDIITAWVSATRIAEEQGSKE